MNEYLKAAYGLASSRQMCCRADLDLLTEAIGTLPPNPVVVQLGAGSGTMGLAVMAARDHITLWSYDIDPQALAWEWEVFKNAKIDFDHGRRYRSRLTDSTLGGKGWLWGAVDLVIVDADHSFDSVIADVYAWRDHCGLMFVHDYDGRTAPQHYPGVRQACDAMWGETPPLYKAGWSAVFKGHADERKETE
jgi:hypothetical protein